VSDNNVSPSLPTPPAVIDTKSIRSGVGYGSFIIAAIFVLVSVFCFLKFSGTLAAPKDKDKTEETDKAEKGKAKGKDKSILDQKEEGSAPVFRYARGSADYFVGGIASALFAIGMIGFATRQLFVEEGPGVPPISVEGGLIGAFFGVVLSLFAVGIAWNRQKVFFDLTGPEFWEHALPALVIVLIFFSGLVIGFVSLMLVRSQERVNPTVRRLIYGFSSTMLVIIVGLVLLVVNAIVAVQVPNALVANESAFQGLSQPSKEFLKPLDTPVKAYLIMSESNQGGYDGLYSDARALLTDCRNASSKFEYEILTPGVQDSRISDIFTRYKVEKEDIGESGQGILLVINDDASRKMFFPAISLYSFEQAVPGRMETSVLVFQGENKILSTLISQLDQNSSRTIYFTQGHGEVPFEQGPPDPKGNASDSLAQLVAVLRERKYDVKPLPLNKANAKVPDDAGVVVIAEPAQTVPVDSPMQTALRKYADKGGRILAFIPATFDKGKVQPTGLEEFFIEYGIKMDGDKRYVGGPTMLQSSQGVAQSFEHFPCLPLDKSSSPLTSALRNTPQQLLAMHLRPTVLVPSQKGYINSVVLVTPPRKMIWKETTERVNIRQVAEQFEKDEKGALLEAKEFSETSKIVAVVSSKGDEEGKPAKPRLILVSATSILPTSGDPQASSEAKNSIIPSMLDHLQERDAGLGIQPKKLPTYKPTGSFDLLNRMLFMLLVMGVVVGLGITVWFARRR